MPMVAESWFRSLWKTPRKGGANSEKVVIGVLAFEVASLMSKIVNLWQSLSDKQVDRLRDEITNSVGIKKLVSVSDDENFIVRLISLEMLENMAHVAESVTRLGKKCSDSSLKGFGNAFDEFITLGVDPYKWEFTSKKMDKKVKRMEKFISTNASLYQEMEVLNDLEQTLRRMKAYGESIGPNVVDYQKKVEWKKLEVKNLKDNSIWNRTYDYAVLLLARSLFTIVSRINKVFGIQEIIDAHRPKISSTRNSGYSHDSQSVSELLQPSAPSSQNNVNRFASGPLGDFAVKPGPSVRKNKSGIFRSGPLGDSSINSGPVSGKYKHASFFSGPLGRNWKKPLPDNGTNRNSMSWRLNGQSTTISGKETDARHSRLTQVGPFKGCMAVDSSSVVDCHSNSNDVSSRTQNPGHANSNLPPSGNGVNCTRPVFSSICKLKPPSDSLGAASLALHYANVIIVIEKIAASPYMIGLDARDDLYNMLPRRVRDALRAKLKPYPKAMTTDTILADEWTEAMTSILEWLAPLAHNMLRWQSERSYEQHSFVSRTNVLLVQTLYFANQERTEAAITELLVGLNYVWRHVRDPNAKTLVECGSSRVENKYPQLNGKAIFI